jgi:hypothetical protein
MAQSFRTVHRGLDGSDRILSYMMRTVPPIPNPSTTLPPSAPPQPLSLPPPHPYQSAPSLLLLLPPNSRPPSPHLVAPAPPSPSPPSQPRVRALALPTTHPRPQSLRPSHAADLHGRVRPPPSPCLPLSNLQGELHRPVEKPTLTTQDGRQHARKEREAMAAAAGPNLLRPQAFPPSTRRLSRRSPHILRPRPHRVPRPQLVLASSIQHTARYGCCHPSLSALVGQPVNACGSVHVRLFP